MFVLRKKIYLFVFFVFFIFIVVGCNEDPIKQYGAEVLDVYEGTKINVDFAIMQNLQRAVNMYRISNEKLPDKLEDIAYMMDSSVDFTKFQYDPKTGKVSLRSS